MILYLLNWRDSHLKDLKIEATMHKIECLLNYQVAYLEPIKIM